MTCNWKHCMSLRHPVALHCIFACMHSNINEYMHMYMYVYFCIFALFICWHFFNLVARLVGVIPMWHYSFTCETWVICISACVESKCMHVCVCALSLSFGGARVCTQTNSHILPGTYVVSVWYSDDGVCDVFIQLCSWYRKDATTLIHTYTYISKYIYVYTYFPIFM